MRYVRTRLFRRRMILLVEVLPGTVMLQCNSVQLYSSIIQNVYTPYIHMAYHRLSRGVLVLIGGKYKTVSGFR
jgi:hypothetical protein